MNYAKINQQTKLGQNQYIYVIFLILICINFMNIGSYLPVLFLPILSIRFITEKHRSSSYLIIFLLLLFGLLYPYIMNTHKLGSFGIQLLYLFIPISSYLFGYYSINNYKTSEKFTKYLLIIVFSMSIFGFLSVMMTIQEYGSLINADPYYARRGSFDLWGNYLVATNMNTYFAIGCAVLPMVFVTFHRKIKIILLISFVTSILSVYILGNRTGIVIAILSMLVYFIIQVFEPRKFIKYTVITLSVFFLLSILYSANVFGIKNSIEQSLLIERLLTLNLLDDPRLNSWLAAFVGLFENPLGGRRTDLALDFAHNFWLDIGYDTGIIPFVIIVLVTIIFMGDFIYYYKNNLNQNVSQIVLCFQIAFYFSFMLEPILQGNAKFFMLFCVLAGMINKYNKLMS